MKQRICNFSQNRLDVRQYFRIARILLSNFFISSEWSLSCNVLYWTTVHFKL